MVIAAESLGLKRVSRHAVHTDISVDRHASVVVVVVVDDEEEEHEQEQEEEEEQEEEKDKVKSRNPNVCFSEKG